MKATVEEELNRAGQYIESKFEDLGDNVRKIVAEGLSYDIKIFKNGVEVDSVPIPIAGAVMLIGFVPPVRILSVLGLVAANFAGYTFRMYKKPAPKK